MYEEFYNYIATRIIGYFEQECDNIHDGDRFCFRLDNEELVKKVNEALFDITHKKDLQGTFSYQNIYHTFTLKLASKEIVIAAQVDGMTDDFFATLRNIPLSINKNPILMITCSPIDTISSASRDFSAKGMPFCADELINTIEKSIEDSHLSDADHVLLKHELKRKQLDRYADRKSLFEYRSFLTSVCVGKVSNESWMDFRLLPDSDGLALISDQRKQEQRIDENHRDFDLIDRVFRLGNLRDGLDGSFDSKFISDLETKKRHGDKWFENLTYEDVLCSKARKDKKLSTPLDIDNDSITAYCGSRLEYEFHQDEKLFIRNGGVTKAKQREKHILIYNPDRKTTVTVLIPFNIAVRKELINIKDQNVATNFGGSKELQLQIQTGDCVFVNVDIHDPNSSTITFHLKICVVDLNPSYLENLQTCYRIEGSGKNRRILAEGIKDALIINPGAPNQVVEEVKEGGEYSCNLDTTLKLDLEENSIPLDKGKAFFKVTCGSVPVYLGISDDIVKPSRLTGVKAFKQKNERKRGFEYRFEYGNEKIAMGTTPYYAVGGFQEDLRKEAFIIENQALYAIKGYNGEYVSQEIEIPEDIRDTYLKFLEIFKNRKQLPSLAYYDDELSKAAEAYIASYEDFLKNVKEGEILSQKHNNVLKLGTIYDNARDIIAFTPVHPLNVMYQLQIRQELGLGEVRDDIVDRLSSANLLPYIKGDNQEVYQVVEQHESPEWRYYTLVDGDHYNEIRDFVPKLVAEKIEEYYAHFRFLFDGIGDHCMILSLHNLGECREIFLGIIRYFKKRISDNLMPDEILNFEVNIYSDKDSLIHHNDFSVLSNLSRTKAYLCEIDGKYENNSDLASLLVSKVHFYIHKEADESYRYAHIAFYQMLSSDKCGDSQISQLTTGTSLNGIISGVPSVLDEGWYKTGYGMKYAPGTPLNEFAALLNSIYRVAYSSSTYTPDHCITTEVNKEARQQLDKVYSAANWVVFVDPKVDLSFFYQDKSSKDLLIIHYGDQNSSASGYNAITVTRKAEQYERIIAHELEKKNVQADPAAAKRIIDFFNAINGRWLLRLISSKRALDSTFSREKMSIISAVKFAMAYYTHKDIVWVPISLEELLRVSGNTGLSQNNGLLSARNLAFDHGATCDDLLLIGVEKANQGIYIHLHPIEVKIGLNEASVIDKAKNQVINTHKGLLNALWPDGEERNTIERKVVRNFIMQLTILSCEKMKLYNIYPEESWQLVLDECREALLNERYEISEAVNEYIGIGTIISFKQGESLISGEMDSENNIAILQLPEQEGYNYLVKSVTEVAHEIEQSKFLPPKLADFYTADHAESIKEYQQQKEAHEEAMQAIHAKAHEDSPAAPEQKAETLPEKQTNVLTTESAGKPNTSEPVKTNQEISILFGQDQNTGMPVFWHPGNTDEVFHTNTGIIGTMGTGKTQFTQSLVTQLYRQRVNNVGSPDIGILIFDYKGDYNESKQDFVTATNAKVLKPYHLPYNPFALTQPRVFKPLLPIHVANTFNDTLSRVYHLGPKQSSTLLGCIKSAYASKGISPNDSSTWTLPAPTFQNVYSLYMGDDSIKKGDSLEAALRTLSDFEVFESDSRNTEALFDLLQGVVVIDISGYDTDLQNLIIAITLDLFYAQMQARGSSRLIGNHRQLTKMILVDEADNFLHEGFPSLKKILKEGREFGVGTILSTQFLKHFGSGDDDFSKYILTWVVHNVADLKNTDIRFVFNTEANSAEEAKLFGDVKKLQKHYSIVKMGNCPKPIYIKDKAFWELFLELQNQDDQ